MAKRTTSPFVLSIGLALLLLLLLPLAEGTAMKVSSLIRTETRCQDDPRFRFRDVSEYHCEWIAAQEDGICDWEVLLIDDDDVNEDRNDDSLEFVSKTIGQVHCPVSCGHCAKDVTERRVYTDSLCYDSVHSHSRNGGVMVSFANDDPQPQDWIGIYPVSATEESFEIGSNLKQFPIAWSWACDISIGGMPNMDDDDNISTSCKVKYNQVVFRQLPPGIYQVILARADNEVFARGHSFFEIVNPSAGGSELCSQRRMQEVKEPCERLEVDSIVYQLGEDIQVHVEQCQEAARTDDYIAIYPSDTDLEDIKGDADYIMWMWACGSHICQQAVTSQDLVFGAPSDRNRWPLAAGEYQAHFLKHLDVLDGYASVAQSRIFTIVDNNNDDEEEQDAEECSDDLRSKQHCHKEGDMFSIFLSNECEKIGPEDWIGFYAAEDCSEKDQNCQGEPLLWTMACKDGHCRAGHMEYRFHGYRNKSDSILLTAGNYRVALVAEGDTADEGPYFARLLSQPFQVREKTDSCHLLEQQM